MSATIADIVLNVCNDEVLNFCLCICTNLVLILCKLLLHQFNSWSLWFLWILFGNLGQTLLKNSPKSSLSWSLVNQKLV